VSEKGDELGICPACGSRGIEMANRPIDMGGPDERGEVDPGFEYEHCTVCGEDFVPACEVDGLLRRSIVLEREGSGLLSSADIRSVRLDLGLTQAGLASLLGVGDKTVTRWETGTVIQSRMADHFVRLLAAHPEIAGGAGASVALEGRGPYRSRRKSAGTGLPGDNHTDRGSCE
jgi:putative zinc finger/helix-turn-helix YgiT family protein